MEIKHTFEILAKDIQDIENLVRNMQNSPRPAGIELDLAMSKLRNIYEVLLLIREDLSELTPADEIAEPVLTVEENNVQDPEIETGNDAMEKEEEKITTPSKDPIASEEKPKEAEKQPKSKKEAEILAEKFGKESSLNENLGTKRPGDMTSRLASQPIDNISRNIGINDRFYIIKELFKGDSEGFNTIIKHLDASTNFNDAFHIIENRFPDDIDHDGVQILVNLARRKFITSGNV